MTDTIDNNAPETGATQTAATPAGASSEPTGDQYEDNWQDHFPKSAARTMKSAAINPRQKEIGGVDLDEIKVVKLFGGDLGARRASEIEYPVQQPAILGQFLAPSVTVLLGGSTSRASSLGLAIAKAVALGGSVLSLQPERATVLYVDPVRPVSDIVRMLKPDLARLDNLIILGADAGRKVSDVLIRSVIADLRKAGTPPRLVIVNEIGRFTNASGASEFKRDVDDDTAFLLVMSDPKYRPHKRFSVDTVKVVDMMSTEKVLTLQPANDDTARLSIFEYGELVSEIAVEPSGSWKQQGKPEEQVRGSRQDKVLRRLLEAAGGGLTGPELAAICEIAANNVHQAMHVLKPTGQVVAVRNRYYAKGFEPPAMGGKNSTT